MFLAAFFAGVVNSIAGGGMLLVFPMMIWLGLDPKIANATCTVALVPGLFGGLFGYRRTMDDSSIILMRLGAVSLVGGGIGAWLLIKTPSPTFARLVPFLILFATLLFMVQGPVNRWLRLPSVESESTKQSWIIVMVDSVLLGDVWRLFRRGQWNSDVGGDGSDWPARHSPGQRHQEFSGHLYQRHRGFQLLDRPYGFRGPGPCGWR